MKASQILEESNLFEGQDFLAEEGAHASEYIEEMLEDIADIRELLKEGMLPMRALPVLDDIIQGMHDDLDDGEVEDMLEAVQRQFRRYGDKFLRQYRCTTGAKAGRLVSSPEKCGIRKDPKKVRQGKKSARIKKGQRIRKTLFTKRKTQSKRLSRLNKVLRGDRDKPKTNLQKKTKERTTRKATKKTTTSTKKAKK